LLSPLTMLRTHGGATHNLCDRPVPSVINSVGWSTSPCFWKLLPFAVVIGGAPIWEEARARPRLRRISMSDQRGFVSADHFRPDPYTQSRIAERTLNAAIVHAEIARSYEEYLEIFDAFYADDVEGSSETTEEPIRGKPGVHSLICGFLVPLHAMAEVGGVSISARQTRFLEMSSTRPILRGHWSWSGRQARSAP
jgi:hypothetical protein